MPILEEKRPIRATAENAWRIAMAPMMGCTDRHFRYLVRLLSRKVRLYTEMISCKALLHGDASRLLAYDPLEHPLALQLGGGDAAELAACAALAEKQGYDEVNLNAGCPSSRVCAGNFGAQLFKDPDRAAACVAAMCARTRLPVTVKTRIGVDQQDHPRHLEAFARKVLDAGCAALILHARKAWLKGLSPRANRNLPPLRHAQVYALKRSFPGAIIILNGGVNQLDQADQHLERVDGVMLGRAAYRGCMLLAQVDQRYHGTPARAPGRTQLLRDYRPYVARELARGTPLAHMGKHLAGLLRGLPGASARRQLLNLPPAPAASELGRYDALLQWLQGVEAHANPEPHPEPRVPISP